MDQEVFIISVTDGRLCAFYNVVVIARTPLVKGQGNAKLICHYHQWCYQTGGRFRGARGRDTLENCIPETANSRRFKLSYGGFLFVNLDLGAVPLEKQAPRLVKDMHQACPHLSALSAMKWQ